MYLAKVAVGVVTGYANVTSSTNPGRNPGSTGNLPEVCPNCDSTDRDVEPLVDENGILTNLLSVFCTGCGYRLGEIPLLPPGDEADDEEKSLAILPAGEPEE